MSNLTYSIVTPWAQNCADGGTRRIPQRQAARVSVSLNGDAILSYGWWEMARILRDRKGQPVRFLINGDTYSVTTSRQQSEVRAAIQRTGLPSVIVPYSVLDEAGIERDSIDVLDVQADRTVATTTTKTENPGRWEHDSYPVYDDHGGWQNTLTGEIVLRDARNPWGAQRPDTVCNCDRPQLVHGTYGPLGYKYEGGYSSPQYIADLAAHNEAIAAETAHRRLRHGDWEEIPASRRPSGRKRIVSGPNGRTEWTMVWDDEAQTVTYQNTRHRHLLGGSLITARVRYRRANGATATRTARFLSGFDEQETRPSYFFCELPRTSRAATIDEAYADLKPATVKTAEALGREVKRQGDIFAVPLTMTTAELTASGAERVKGAYILGTNHRATEVATIGKLTYIRGTISHAPQGRASDHKRVTVGKQWHLVLKNTVPVAA